MTSLLDSPTRCAPSGRNTLIDHILSNVMSVQEAGAANFDLTDHYPIFLLLKTQTNCKNKMVNGCRFDSAKFVDLVSRFDWGKLSQEPCVNKAFSTLTEKLTGIINSCTSVSTISRWYSAPRNPWITRGLLRSINKKDNLYKKVKLQPFNLSLRTRFKLYSQTLTVLLKKSQTNLLSK